MLKFIRTTVIAFCVLTATVGFSMSQDTWQTLKPGLFYRQIQLPSGFFPSRLHAFKIDLNKYQVSSVFAKDHEKNALSARKFADQYHALIAINGGFFSPNFHPLGLRINNGRQKNPLKKTSWWGVFYIRDNRARIVPLRSFRHSKKIQFAIQGGPRLVANGKILKLKPGSAERTALGITRDNKLIIAVTENAAMSTSELAQIMASPMKLGGLDCRQAINLDGGSSTQLYAKIGDFVLDLPSFATVTDAIIIQAK